MNRCGGECNPLHNIEKWETRKVGSKTHMSKLDKFRDLIHVNVRTVNAAALRDKVYALINEIDVLDAEAKQHGFRDPLYKQVTSQLHDIRRMLTAEIENPMYGQVASEVSVGAHEDRSATSDPILFIVDVVNPCTWEEADDINTCTRCGRVHV
jgi:hypothetical protein